MGKWEGGGALSGTSADSRTSNVQKASDPMDGPTLPAMATTTTTTEIVPYDSGHAAAHMVFEERTGPYVYYDFNANEWVSTTKKRLLRVEHPGGRTEHFGGPPGQEHRVLLKDESTGKVLHFAGTRGHEHLVRKRDSEGNDTFFDGPNGEEHMIRIEFANGNILFFDGPRGQERRFIGQTAEGVTAFYEGPKNAETIVHVGRVKMATYEKIE